MTVLARWVVVFVIFGGALAGVVYAQADSPPAPQPATDPYGNVLPPDPEYREVGIILRDSPRVDRIGGIDILSRWRAATNPGNTLGLTGNPPAAPTRPLGLTAPSPAAQAQHKLFSQHGGFEPRKTEPPASPATTVARPFGLIAATKLNTPVQRAMMRNTGLSAMVAAQIQVGPPAVQPDAVPEAPVHLDQVLREQTGVNHARSAREGWSRFAEGQYRAASRAFSSAADLDPSDLESRLGDLFCQISLGAGQTAGAALDALVRRFENPFVLNLDLSGRFGSLAQANDVRTRAKVYAQIEGADAVTIAVHALSLWYLGEPEEAIRAATVIGTKFPGSPYARWPEQMRAVREARTAAPQP